MNQNLIKLFAILAFITFSSNTFAAQPITEKEVLDVQEAWANGIIEIGEAYKTNGDYQAKALAFIEKMYAYDDGGVLFKPTKATETQFRSSKAKALSYFVGGKVKEDKGFAITPWSKVRFENTRDIIADDNFAIAMGNYYFTAENSTDEVKVEYTFGYKRGNDDRIIIFLHHSSVPFQK